MAHKTDQFMPVEIEPWTKKTARLSAAARGAYIDLLFAYWRGENLPADDDDALMRLARCTEAEWASVWPKLKPYFIQEGNVYRQNKADEMKAQAKQRYEQKATAGEAGGKASGKQRRSKPPREHEADTKQDGQQNGSGDPSGGEQIRILENSPSGEIQPSAGEDAPLKARIFGECLAWLAKATMRPEKELRPLVGKWCSQAGDGATLQAISQSQTSAALDPIPFIERILKNLKAAPAPKRGEPAEMRQTNRVEWVAYYRGYLKTNGKVWPMHAGAKPGEPDCACPADVIAEVDAEAKVIPIRDTPPTAEQPSAPTTASVIPGYHGELELPASLVRDRAKETA